MLPSKKLLIIWKSSNFWRFRKVKCKLIFKLEYLGGQAKFFFTLFFIGKILFKALKFLSNFKISLHQILFWIDKYIGKLEIFGFEGKYLSIMYTFGKTRNLRLWGHLHLWGRALYAESLQNFTENRHKIDENRCRIVCFLDATTCEESVSLLSHCSSF